MEIELKIDPAVFFAVAMNEKRVEVRRDDRPFDAGVVLNLKETKHSGEEMAAGAPLIYTGRYCKRVITHCLRGYGLQDGFVALSIRPLTKAEK